jgi:DNA-binding NarL/FixJ family response regulator
MRILIADDHTLFREPALVVFQTPPEPAATYQVPGAVGWTEHRGGPGQR